MFADIIICSCEAVKSTCDLTDNTKNPTKNQKTNHTNQTKKPKHKATANHGSQTQQCGL